MAANCGFVFGVCRTRITKVDALGNVVAGDNSYVTDNTISVAVAPNKETGNSFTARNGCGCAPARFKMPDILNWYDLTIVRGTLEPEMEALLFGTTTIMDNSDAVGATLPGTLACDDEEPAVAVEFWAKHIVGSAQDATYPWIHFVFPMTIWSPGDSTLEENFFNPQAVGFSRTNTQWGDGPYGDGPPDSTDIADGAWWKTADEPPTADCGASAVTATS